MGLARESLNKLIPSHSKGSSISISRATHPVILFATKGEEGTILLLRRWLSIEINKFKGLPVFKLSLSLRKEASKGEFPACLKFRMQFSRANKVVERNLIAPTSAS